MEAEAWQKFRGDTYWISLTLYHVLTEYLLCARHCSGQQELSTDEVHTCGGDLPGWFHDVGKGEILWTIRSPGQESRCGQGSGAGWWTLLACHFHWWNGPLDAQSSSASFLSTPFPEIIPRKSTVLPCLPKLNSKQNDFGCLFRVKWTFAKYKK